MTAAPSLPVRISLPPMISGISVSVPARRASSAFSAARSGVPGAWLSTGSLNGGGAWLRAFSMAGRLGQRSPPGDSEFLSLRTP